MKTFNNFINESLGRSSRRDRQRFKRKELDFELGREASNNVAIEIDGKVWKVIPGRGEYPTRALQRANKMADTIKRNAAAKGRKEPEIKVYVTAAPVTE